MDPEQRGVADGCLLIPAVRPDIATALKCFALRHDLRRPPAAVVAEDHLHVSGLAAIRFRAPTDRTWDAVLPVAVLLTGSPVTEGPGVVVGLGVDLRHPEGHPLLGLSITSLGLEPSSQMYSRRWRRDCPRQGSGPIPRRLRSVHRRWCG